MSRIYFHDVADRAELRGSERAYAGGLSTDYLMMALGLDRYTKTDDPVMSLFPSDVARGAHFHGSLPEAIHVWMVVEGMDEDEGLRRPDGSKVPIFQVALNTMLASGSDPIKLLARLHGQCELHAYVEGHNRGWLAGVIERGRSASILRVDQGWESVVTLLRAASDTPVVTSYSVTESWPDVSYCDDYVPYDDELEIRASEADTISAHEAYMKAWYALSPAQQWDKAMPALRKMGDGNREMRPDQWDWDAYTFGMGESGYSLLEAACAAWRINER